MWPFTNKKREQEAQEIEQSVREAVEGLNDSLDKALEKSIKPKFDLVLYFNDESCVVYTFDTARKRNIEAKKIRDGINECHDWVAFKDNNNREQLVDARCLTLVRENDK